MYSTLIIAITCMRINTRAHTIHNKQRDSKYVRINRKINLNCGRKNKPAKRERKKKPKNKYWNSVHHRNGKYNKTDARKKNYDGKKKNMKKNKTIA